MIEFEERQDICNCICDCICDWCKFRDTDYCPERPPNCIKDSMSDIEIMRAVELLKSTAKSLHKKKMFMELRWIEDAIKKIEEYDKKN